MTTSVDDRHIARWRFANQCLGARTAPSPTEVVSHLLAVQAENYAQASWAVATRTSLMTERTFNALFDTGAILRTHVLRPTWHFVTPTDLGWLLELTGPRLDHSYDQLRRTLPRTNAEVDRDVETIENAIRAEGPLTRPELGDRLTDDRGPAGREALTLALARAELTAVICSGPRRGNHHTYALVEERAPRTRHLDRADALAEMTLRYFDSHGPATERDLAYWATLTLGDVRAGLESVGDQLSSFTHDGRTYWYGGRFEPDPPDPGGHLLQILDECYRGYQDSRWVLDADGLVPRTREKAIGLALIDAQIVATMKRKVRSRQVQFNLGPYRSVTTDEVAAIERAAASYGAFLEAEPVVIWDT